MVVVACPMEDALYKFNYNPPMSTAAIALGANLGDRRSNLQAALRALAAVPGVHLLIASAFLENPSVGGPEGAPNFLNAAACIQTTLTPGQVLERLLEIERQLGRSRGPDEMKNDPRPIDLDLLLYDDLILETGRLILPHPRMHQRLFVLIPLAEIVPDVIHPALNKSIRQLLREVSR